MFKDLVRTSHSKRIMSSKIEIPPHYPPSRYEATGGDLIVDHGNQKILSLPTLIDRTLHDQIQMHHIGIRSVEDELINETENALLGGHNQASTDSSGVHPGILYGGPAGGILAPIGVYFYRIMKKRFRRKKQQKQTRKEEIEAEDEEDNYEVHISDSITRAVGNQISSASSSVVNHIKGKITETGSSLVKDLKAQAIAQEEEILENVKTTLLQQEEAMVANIKEKFNNTQNTLIQDIQSKLWFFKKSTSNSTFEEKRKEEETLCKLSDSEEDVMNSVKRRISNAQDALIPEIEKSITATNENIIKNIERDIPEAKGSTLNKFKASMKYKSRSLFNDIRSILTCTENKILDDVKSRIEEIKTGEMVRRSSRDASHTLDEVRIEIIQPHIENMNTNKASKCTKDDSNNQDEIQLNILQPKIITDINKNTAKELRIEKQALGFQNNSNGFDEIEHQVSDISTHSTETTPTELKKESSHMEDKISKCQETSNQILKPQDHHEGGVSSETKEKFVSNENSDLTSRKCSKLSEVKDKIEKIPSRLLEHCPRIIHNSTHVKTMIQEPASPEESVKILICAEPITKTSPIPIPCTQGIKTGHIHKSPVDNSDEDIDKNNTGQSSSEDKEDKETSSSFFNIMKNSVSHLPFNLNFSGIPEKVLSFIEPEKNETELAEVTVVDQNKGIPLTHLSGEIREKHQINFEEQDKITESIANPGYSEEESICNSFQGEKPNEETVSEKPSKLKWLELEEVEASWPNHLPRNNFGVSCIVNIQSDQPKKKTSKHHRKNMRERLNQDSDSQDEEDDVDWKIRLSKSLPLKPIGGEEERKESLASTISEFSTTSSIESASTSTLESRDSIPKLPNFDKKLKKRQKRSQRLKSLDSGIHHYYGEYIAIEFPHYDQERLPVKEYKNVGSNDQNVVHPERSCKEEVDDVSHKSEEGSGSSQNSQEDTKSVISVTEIMKTEENVIQNDQVELMRKAEITEGGGCYEGYMISLGNKKFETSSNSPSDSSA